MACLSPCEQEEDRTDRTELLMRFKNSHFFARIAEVDEALWTRKKTQESFQDSGKFIPIESSKDDVAVDRGSLDASSSGGVAKNDVKCSLLANGDIVVCFIKDIFYCDFYYLIFINQFYIKLQQN